MAGKTIKIKIYQPRLWTKELHESDKRWKVVVAHRRSGKTTATLNHIIRDAVNIKNSRFAFIAPTYKQAKNIAWDILKKYARKIDGVVFNESELRADFANGSRITLYGSDNPDALRGIALWGVVFDEYSQQPSNIFSEIIRPALADHKGYAIWIGTPKGKNEFYKLYQQGLANKDWLSILLTVNDTKLIDDKELDDSKAAMTENEYQQEWYCSFEAAIKGAYYSKELAIMKRDNRILEIKHEPELPVYTFWDLGVSDATTILFVQKKNQEIRIIDTHSNTGLGLDHYIQLVLNKPYTYAEHYAPHDIKVRELSSGKSRLEIARKLGITFRLTPNLKIMDGINIARINFKNYYIDSKQEYFLEAISQYRSEWDDTKGIFRDNPLHDWTSHYADALRYMAIGLRDTTSINFFGNNINKPKFI